MRHEVDRAPVRLVAKYSVEIVRAFDDGACAAHDEEWGFSIVWTWATSRSLGFLLHARRDRGYNHFGADTFA